MKEMHRVLLIGLVGLGTFSAVTNGAITVVERDQIAQARLEMERRDAGGGGSTYETQYVYIDSVVSNTIAPDLQTSSAGKSGTLNDTDTNTALVASGEGAGNVTTTMVYNGGDLAGYTLSGGVSSSFTTGTLAGYEPASLGDEVAATAVSVYNASFSITADVPVPYSISATQSGTVGAVYSGAQIYLDANGDKSFDVADGDVSIEDFGFAGDGTNTRTGVLAASALEYRIFFGSNTYDSTIADGTTLMSSGTTTGSFSVVPEPSTLGVLALGGSFLLSRRRRRQTASLRP